MCRRRAVERSDDEDDDPDDMDDDQLDEEEGDNELEAQAASVSRLGDASSMLDSLPSKGEDAMREVQRQRNLEQALFIQMEMQKKLHEQLEVIPETQLTQLSQFCRDTIALPVYACVTILSALAIPICMSDHFERFYKCSMKMVNLCDEFGLSIKLSRSTSSNTSCCSLKDSFSSVWKHMGATSPA